MAKAFDPTMIKSKLGWSNAFDTDSAFPLDLRAWFGSYESAQAAAQTAVEFGSTESKYYYGQQLYVFDGTTAKTYLIQGDKSLKEIGSGNSQPMKFVKDEEAMLALEDIQAGQQVYREDTKSIWIYKGTDPSDLGNWVESAAGSDTVWSGTENKVIFYALEKTTYDGIGVKDTNTLYFLTDAGKIYKGETDITKSATVVSDFPEASAAVPGMLYINNTTFEVKLTTDKASWITTSPGYLTDGAEWAAADSGKFATIGLIRKGIDEAVAKCVASMGEGEEDKIVLSTAAGGVKRGEAVIGGAQLSEDPDAATVATEAAVAAVMSWGTLG